jgi:FkbM family methyltransferase
MEFVSKVIRAAKTISNIHLFILDSLGLIRSEIIYLIKNTGVKIIARGGTNDCKEIVVIFSGLDYPVKILPELRNPVIMDIGSYIGEFALYTRDYYRKTHPLIIAVEPASENYKLLRRNISLNNFPDIITINAAVGPKNTNGTIRKNNVSFDGYRAVAMSGGSGESCKFVNISTLAKRYKLKVIDVLKMDIEGGEYPILSDRKSFDFLRNNVRYIFMEYHYLANGYSYRTVKNRIEANFTPIYHWHNLICLRNNKFYNRNN